MPVLVNSIDVSAEPEAVFDCATDLAHELEGHGERSTHITRLTKGPIGVGTRYQAQWPGSRAFDVEYQAFDRPRSWITKAPSRGVDMIQHGEVSPIAGGVRLTSRLELRPKGWMRLISPLVALWMQRVEVQTLAEVKRTVEGSQ
jgi:polyketide cyclase/dehydrase/lipid transport protein